MQQFQSGFIHICIHAMVFDTGEGELCNQKKLDFVKKIFHMTMFFVVIYYLSKLPMPKCHK